jgi:hypothetical protein
MNDRRRRSLQLFVVSVITATLLLVVLYLMVSIWAIEHAKEPEAPRQQGLSLPQLCAPLYARGRHKSWAECMGVGYDDTPIDKHLYAHRGDD